jgi:hypothetical protein
MKELNAKLIVSDFDGTLITGKQEVKKEVKEAIDEYIANGGIFAVVTGRMMASILPIVRGLGLKGLVAGFQGSVIADIESGKIIKNNGFSSEEASFVCKTLEDLGAYVNLYQDENLYTDIPADNKYLKLYEDITKIYSKHPDCKMSEFALNNEHIYQKVTSLCFPQEKIKLYNKVNALIGDKFDVTYSADVLVEVSPKEDNKGTALKFLADYYNIPIEKTVAVGDNLNDLSMIKVAGVGVAVGNATDALKEHADFISVSNEEGAIAQVIEKFGYNN